MCVCIVWVWFNLGVFLYQECFSPGKRLDFEKWLLAWDPYSLAGAALGQFTYAASRHHLRNVSRVAMGAVVNKRRAIMGVLYDETARCVLIVCAFSGLRVAFVVATLLVHSLSG